MSTPWDKAELLVNEMHQSAAEQSVTSSLFNYHRISAQFSTANDRTLADAATGPNP